MSRVLPFALTALLIAPGAMAQEAIPTVPAGPAAGAAATTATAPITLPDRLDRGDEGPLRVGPCGTASQNPDGKPDKGPHGEVWAGVGTHGYREIGGVVCQPLGANSALTIAVDRTELGGPR